MQSLSNAVAREQATDRLRTARRRQRVAQTSHPPSGARWRAAHTVARIARRLDPDAARLAIR